MSEKKVKIIAVGDISPGDHYFSLGHGVRSKYLKLKSSLITSEVKHILARGNVVLCNLEGVLSDSGLDDDSFESIAFRGHPAMAESLASAGFTLANIANNHIMQHGINAFNETISNLKLHGIKTLGLSAEDLFSSQPVIEAINSLRIGFLGYSLVAEQHTKGSTPYSRSQPEIILKDIMLLKKKVDFVVISCHFGVEAVRKPSRQGIILAHSMIDAGANVILGHHPHVLQPVERYRHGVVIYSLGNFIFDLLWDRSLVRGGIAEITIDGSGCIDVIMHTTIINRSCQPCLMKMPTAGCLTASPAAQSDDTYHEKEFSNYYYYHWAYKTNRRLSRKKTIFFLSRLPYGNSGMKLRFIVSKICKRIKAEKATVEA